MVETNIIRQSDRAERINLIKRIITIVLPLLLTAHYYVKYSKKRGKHVLKFDFHYF